MNPGWLDGKYAPKVEGRRWEGKTKKKKNKRSWGKKLLVDSSKRGGTRTGGAHVKDAKNLKSLGMLWEGGGETCSVNTRLRPENRRYQDTSKKPSCGKQPEGGC